MQGADKTVSEFRHKVKRAAEEGDVSANRLSLCKTGDSLVTNRLKNGSREVFSRSTFVDERLNIRFGKNTAACGNGINHLIVLSQFV